MTNFEHMVRISFDDMACLLDDLENLRKGRRLGEDWKQWLAREYEPELARCPFRGRTDTLIVGDSDFIMNDDGHNSFAVCCDHGRGGCGACSGFENSEDKAIKKWNMRAK